MAEKKGIYSKKFYWKFSKQPLKNENFHVKFHEISILKFHIWIYTSSFEIGIDDKRFTLSLVMSGDFLALSKKFNSLH